MPRPYFEALGPGFAARVRRFLVAQGWAGLLAGDYLEQHPERYRTEVKAVLGVTGEVRALAVHPPGVLGLLLPFPELAGPGGRLVAEAAAGQVGGIVLIEGQLPSLTLPGFIRHVQEVAVGIELPPPRAALPAARLADPADAGSLRRLYDEVSWMREQSEETWRERLSQGRTWLVEQGGEAVAACRWSRAFGGLVEVGAVATRSEFRRRGLASQVVLAAGRAAEAQGLRPVLRYRNLELVALYRPLGFEPVGRELRFERESPAQ